MACFFPWNVESISLSWLVIWGTGSRSILPNMTKVKTTSLQKPNLGPVVKIAACMLWVSRVKFGAHFSPKKKGFFWFPWIFYGKLWASWTFGTCCHVSGTQVTGDRTCWTWPAARTGKWVLNLYEGFDFWYHAWTHVFSGTHKPYIYRHFSTSWYHASRQESHPKYSGRQCSVRSWEGHSNYCVLCSWSESPISSGHVGPRGTTSFLWIRGNAGITTVWLTCMTRAGGLHWCYERRRLQQPVGKSVSSMCCNNNEPLCLNLKHQIFGGEAKVCCCQTVWDDIQKLQMWKLPEPADLL